MKPRMKAVATSGGIGMIGSDNYLKIFEDWIERLQESLRKTLPPLPDATKASFCAACCAAQASDKARLSAIAVKESLDRRKDPPATDQELQDASKAIESAETALKTSKEVCKTIAANSLLPNLEDFLSADYDDKDLVVFTVLSHGTAKLLAEWCEASPEQADQLMTALQDVDLLRLFLQSGGARNGRYGPAVQGYRQLMKSPNCTSNRVLHDLALATALELADPYTLFNERGTTDILQRYMHYEQAYLLGELDPNFSTFNVWELRQIVNSDATEEELGWGRRSLAAYRPDICLWPDDQWTYCRVVKTDISYKDPDFYKEPKSYDQILAGGGKCGPRAWYGRFICKAYGIPTWGVRQPGHAAMTRWTPHGGGWVTRLGAGMEYSWWEDQGGLDFLLETQARIACGSLDVYAQKVLRLQWVSAFFKEDQSNIRRNSMPDDCSPWCSLGMMQRCLIASQEKFSTSINGYQKLLDDPCVEARIQRIRLHKLTAPHQITDDSKSIVIPAATCTSPTATTKKVLFLPSFLGGQQLFMDEDAEVEYTLPQSCLGTFEISFLVATAHRFEKNLTIICGDETFEIPMKYTMSLWEKTEPVKAQLSSNKLVVKRSLQPFGVSFREIHLVRVNAEY